SGKHFDIPVPKTMIPVLQTNPFGSVIDGNGDFHKWNGFEEDIFQRFLEKHGDQHYVLLKQNTRKKILENLATNTTGFVDDYSDVSKQDVIRVTLAQIVCDKSVDEEIRKKAFKALENLRSINLRGLKQWVQKMAPEIQN
ncbi:MAG: hypothetical protein QXG67_02100, partial [Candidatus Nitrosotenuis sp.]